MYKRYSPIPMSAKVIEIGGIFYLGTPRAKRRVYLFKSDDDARAFAETREWPKTDWLTAEWFENVWFKPDFDKIVRHISVYLDELNAQFQDAVNSVMEYWHELNMLKKYHREQNLQPLQSESETAINEHIKSHVIVCRVPEPEPCQDTALSVIAEPEALKQGSAAEIKAVADLPEIRTEWDANRALGLSVGSGAPIPVREPVRLAPIPVAPFRKQYQDMMHNRRKVDSRPMSYRQYRYLHALTGINFNKYLKRARLSTKRASLLIGYCLKKAA